MFLPLHFQLLGQAMKNKSKSETRSAQVPAPKRTVQASLWKRCSPVELFQITALRFAL